MGNTGNCEVGRPCSESVLCLAVVTSKKVWIPSIRIVFQKMNKLNMSATFELFQATLDESLYELAGELVCVFVILKLLIIDDQIYMSLCEMIVLYKFQVRFLLRSGRDYENVTTESDKLSPRFLGYFLFRSSYKRQSSDLKRFE